jgi:hypothetical protein
MALSFCVAFVVQSVCWVMARTAPLATSRAARRESGSGTVDVTHPIAEIPVAGKHQICSKT